MNRGVVIALAAVVLAAGACGSRVRDDVWDDLASTDARAQPPATSVARRAESADDGRAGGASPATPQGRPDGDNPSVAPGPRAASAGALPAPADGTYTYDETEDGEHRTTSER